MTAHLKYRLILSPTRPLLRNDFLKLLEEADLIRTLTTSETSANRFFQHSIEEWFEEVHGVSTNSGKRAIEYGTSCAAMISVPLMWTFRMLSLRTGTTPQMHRRTSIQQVRGLP